MNMYHNKFTPIKILLSKLTDEEILLAKKLYDDDEIILLWPYVLEYEIERRGV